MCCASLRLVLMSSFEKGNRATTADQKVVAEIISRGTTGLVVLSSG